MKKIILILAFLMLCVGVVNASVLDDAVSYWKLDNNTNDSIDSNHAGTDSTNFNSSSYINNTALSLDDNVSEYLNLTDIVGTRTSVSFSFSLWVNFTKLNDDEFIFSQYGAANQFGTNIIKLANNTVKYVVCKQNVICYKTYSNNTINDISDFYHIVAQYDSNSLTAELWINGEFNDNVSYNALTSGGANSRHFRVAYNPEWSGSSGDFDVDEIVFFNRSLNKSEIKELFHLFRAEQPSNQAPVVSVSSPANNTQTNVSEAVQFTVTDDNASTLVCSLYVDGSVNLTNNSVLNNTLTTFNPSWSEGSHTFYVNCSDGELSSNSGLFNFYYDSDSPVIQTKLPLPTNTTIFSGYTMNIAGNVTNINLSNVSITISYPNSSVFYANETTSFSDPTLFAWDWVFNTTTEPNGVWSMYIYASDHASNSNDRAISFSVANCIPDWQCSGYAVCNVSDLAACNETTDLNTCGVSYTGDLSEFTDQPCNYCTGDFIEDNHSECIDNIWLVCYTDHNFATCCNITNLASDCLFGVVQSSGCQNESCGGFTPSYDSNDVAPAAINAVGKFILVIGMFVPIIIISYIGFLGWKKLRLMRKK